MPNRNQLTSHMWNYCLQRKPFFASLLGNAIKKASIKPFSFYEVIRYFFSAGCRIRCNEQQIQVYFDTATQRFARLIDRF